LSAAVDILNFHCYDTGGVPENLNTTAQGNIRSSGILNSAELSKPLWVGEGSWGNSFNTGWEDAYAQGGYIPRWFASTWSQTLPYGSAACNWSSEVCQQAFWYGYDYDTTSVNHNNYRTGMTGALYCPGQTAHGSCANGGQNNNGQGMLVPPVGAAPMWNVALGWLENAKPATPIPLNPFCNPLSANSTVWHCDFTVNGTAYSMVWDNSYASSAVGHNNYCLSNFGASPYNPYVCGKTTYTVAPQYTSWQDLSGAVHALDTPIPFLIGLNPVLLCPNSTCLP
jgi:hypothetical protein